MPILRSIDGKLQLQALEPGDLTNMTMSELVDYERLLWHWADTAGSTKAIADILNSIYREVEWRAQEKAWRDAAYPSKNMVR